MIEFPVPDPRCQSTARGMVFCPTSTLANFYLRCETTSPLNSPTRFSEDPELYSHCDATIEENKDGSWTTIEQEEQVT
jgi:hypothetical protein